MSYVLSELVPWPFVHDWGQPAIEHLTWNTDLMRSPVGAEQRRQMRLTPRREIAMSYQVSGQDRQLFQALIAGVGSSDFAVPIDQDAQYIASALSADGTRIDCTTTDIDFVAGNYVMLYDHAFSYELAVIDSIDAGGLDLTAGLINSWPAGTKLLPVRAARISVQPSLLRLTDSADRFPISWIFLDTCTWTATAPSAAYRGYPVFEDAPDESKRLSHTMVRQLLELDNNFSPPNRYDVAGVAFDVRAHEHVVNGVEEKGAYRELLYYLRGMLKAVWMPTWADDLTVLSTIGSSSTSITIANINYTERLKDLPGRRDIRIRLKDDTVFYRRISDASVVDADSETLIIDAAFGQEITVAEIDHISFMMLTRLDHDKVTIMHVTNELDRSTLAFKGVLDDEL